MTEENEKRDNPYSKGKIYKICDTAETMVYIGSTIQMLSKRFYKHKVTSHYEHDNCTSKKIFESFDLRDIKIYFVENFPCESKYELERREGEIIKSTVCINKYVAGRTVKEWKDENKEKIAEYQTEYQKDYRIDNKEDLKVKRKSYVDENRELVLKQKRDSYEKTKEKALEHKKEYYALNKEKIKQQKREYYKRKNAKNDDDE